MCVRVGERNKIMIMYTKMCSSHTKKKNDNFLRWWKTNIQASEYMCSQWDVGPLILWQIFSDERNDSKKVRNRQIFPSNELFFYVEPFQTSGNILQQKQIHKSIRWDVLHVLCLFAPNMTSAFKSL